MFDVIFSHQKQPFTNILYSGNVQKLTWLHWLFFLVNIRPVFCNLTKVGCHHRYCPTKFAISFEMLLYILLSVSMKIPKKDEKRKSLSLRTMFFKAFFMVFFRIIFGRFVTQNGKSTFQLIFPCRLITERKTHLRCSVKKRSSKFNKNDWKIPRLKYRNFMKKRICHKCFLMGLWNVFHRTLHSLQKDTK